MHLARHHVLAGLLAGILLSLGTQPVRAQTYVGLSGGKTQFDIDCTNSTTCDRRSVAYKIFAGYMVSHNFALEVVGYDQGKARFAANDPSLGQVNGSYRGRGIGASAMLMAPYSNKLGLFGKFGFVNARVDLQSTSSVAGAIDRSEHHANVAWGIGASYDLSTAIGVRMEFERARVKFLDDKYDVDMVTAGLYYRF